MPLRILLSLKYTIVSILGLFPSQEIDMVNTFGRQPLTPQVLSAFTVISDETWKYFAIRVYTEVEYSPPLLYYELLVLHMHINTCEWIKTSY